jgi:hypothetical protein
MNKSRIEDGVPVGGVWGCAWPLHLMSESQDWEIFRLLGMNSGSLEAHGSSAGLKEMNNKGLAG